MRSKDGQRKIKVAYVLTPIDFGGAEKVSLNFLKNFNRDKFEIVPILLVRPWEEKVFFAHEIEKHKINYLTIPVAIKPPEKGRDYFRIVRCYRSLFSILRNGCFDLVHTNGYFADILGVPLTKVLRISHVSTCHGFIQNGIRLKAYNMLDVFILKFSNKIISVSDEIKTFLMAHSLPESKINVIGNAVELPSWDNEMIALRRAEVRGQFNIASNEIVIGYIGRLSDEKGLIYLLDASEQLMKKGFPIKIILVGDGAQRAELEERVVDSGCKGIFTFTGFQKDVTLFFPALDIFILPSLTEGTPMAMLEAMSYGLPIIATRVGGVPSVISHYIDGILVDSGDSHSLAGAILRVSHDLELRQKMSNNARKKIKDKYSIKLWGEKIEMVYSTVLGRES